MATFEIGSTIVVITIHVQ